MRNKEKEGKTQKVKAQQREVRKRTESGKQRNEELKVKTGRKKKKVQIGSQQEEP